MKKIVRSLKNQKGITLVVVILIAMGVAMLAFGAIALNVNLSKIISQRKNIKRIHVVRDALKDYYKAHGYLPTASLTSNRVPVGALGLEQKYRLDENGEYYFYSVDNPTISPIIATTTDINGITVDNKNFAAVIISPGSDRTLQSISNDPVFPPSAGWGDDVFVEVNLSAIAEEITISELTLLAKKVWAYRCAHDGSYPPSATAMDTIVNYFSLSDSYITDAWLKDYAWDAVGQKFFSNGNTGRIIKVPEFTMVCPATPGPPAAPTLHGPPNRTQPTPVITYTGTTGDDQPTLVFGFIYTWWDVLFGTPLNDSISGLGGDDWIIGYQGDDILQGDDGNDLVYGGSGDDWLYGGADDDLLRGDYWMIYNFLSIGDWFDGIATGDDVLYGGPGSDRLSGEYGDDYIYGDDGAGGPDVADYLYGGDGNDWMYGGAGADVMRGDSQWDPNNPPDYFIDGTGGITFSGEDFMFGEGGADYLYGGPENDTMFGGNGNDRIYGDDGDDILSGDNGNDRIYGNDGIDEIFGGNGNDRIYGEDGDDILSGQVGIDRIRGGDGEDIIYGGDGNDPILNGQSGNDIIYGDEGQDSISGGSGNDILFGGVNSLVTGGDTDKPTLTDPDAANDTISGNGGSDSIYGCFGDDVLFGNGGADYIYGGEGADNLDGGTGNDYLYPGPGVDSLVGGGGTDIAVFSGSIADYVLTQNSVVADPSGTQDGTNNIVSGIEYYMFDEGVLIDTSLLP